MSDRSRFPVRVAFLCSAKLADAIRSIADQEESTPSDLVRRIVNERLVAGARSPIRVAA
jgi:hypothetical protein